MALGDLDADGDLDAVVANSGGSSRTWLNDGLATFTDSGQELPPATDVALGDLDADGDLDAFLTGGGKGEVVLLNDGHGLLVDASRRLGSLDGAAVALGDLDGDGDLDAAVATWGFPEGQPNRIWLNDGTGTFRDSGFSAGEGVSSGIALADVDADGDLDAVIANQAAPDHSPVADRLWLNDGSGRFTDSGQALGNACAYAALLADLDQDGDTDLFAVNSSHAGKSDPANKVYLNDGKGTLADSGQSLGDSYSLSAALGDVDGDGDLDVYVGNYQAADRLWLNDGTGRFEDSGLRLSGSNTSGVALGDLDGDGDLDAFLVANTWQGGDGRNSVWLNEARRPRPAGASLEPRDGAPGRSWAAASSGRRSGGSGLERGRDAVASATGCLHHLKTSSPEPGAYGVCAGQEDAATL